RYSPAPEASTFHHRPDQDPYTREQPVRWPPTRLGRKQPRPAESSVSWRRLSDGPDRGYSQSESVLWRPGQWGQSFFAELGLFDEVRSGASRKKSRIFKIIRPPCSSQRVPSCCLARGCGAKPRNEN